MNPIYEFDDFAIENVSIFFQYGNISCMLSGILVFAYNDLIKFSSFGKVTILVLKNLKRSFFEIKCVVGLFFHGFSVSLIFAIFFFSCML